MAAAGLLTAVGVHAETASPWQIPWADRVEGSAPRPVPLAVTKQIEAYPVASPRVYEKDRLQYVQMPIGGIGTGTIWLDGQGRLAVWQIFNYLDERRVPDSLLAIRVQAEGKPPVTRILQIVKEYDFEPMKSLAYEGGYPIARLRFQDPELPVQVRLEAFNPMIPIDAANSSIPCVIFRVTVTNTGIAPVQAQVLGALLNAVGGQACGGNRNRLIREPGVTAIAMSQASELFVPCSYGIRKGDGKWKEDPECPGFHFHWVNRVDGTPETEGLNHWRHGIEHGCGTVVSGVTPEFFKAMRKIRDVFEGKGNLEVFDGFEKGSYEGWTAKGEAFGNQPASGSFPGQAPISFFIGKGLANSFCPNNSPQGELVSRPFTVAKRYIGFLIGGGNLPGQVGVNLRVDGKTVRTATGKNIEQLEAVEWDVAEFKDRTAGIEIFDHSSAGWGHVNVDHIVFSDVPPTSMLSLRNTLQAIASKWPFDFEGAELVQTMDGTVPGVEPGWAGVAAPWFFKSYTRLTGFKPPADTCKVLAKAPNGDPLIIQFPMGKANVVLCFMADPPWAWVSTLLLMARGKPLESGEGIAPVYSMFGTMALSSPDPGISAQNGNTLQEIAAAFAKEGRLTGEIKPEESELGKTVRGALNVPLTVPPGQERTATLVLTWHFPSVERHGQHLGNLYARRFADAMAAGRYVCANHSALWERTRLYHDTFYQSNLPPEWLDAASSQSVIFRGPTCWWAGDGYFGGSEGNGCCPLNCTHVWNYAQSHARLFPEIGRNMRESDLLAYIHPDGGIPFRQHVPHPPATDGQTATIVAALREHQLSPDDRFLRKVWPNVRKATEWLIQSIDKDEDGVPSGRQPNTYDCDVSGANTFIGSQYLAALAAGERMAVAMGDAEAAARWRKIREAGMKNQDAKLWNGEYYIQVPDPQPAADYNTGCHSDQLLGQWWAHQLDLGHLYPKERVRIAMQSVMKYNFREKFAGFKQTPRPYVMDDDGGLLMCTWPKGERPKSFTEYSDEVWTGIEYAAAGEMIFEGLIDPARKIVIQTRERYNGRRRDGLNSGPGGNPFNDLECGKFYARAMSSWGLLIAAQGLVLDGPAGILGFKPNWQPENHRSFFTAPKGWGLFIQTREGGIQKDRIEVRHGWLKLKELVFAVPENMGAPTATVFVAAKRVKAEVQTKGTEVRLQLGKPLEVSEGTFIEVTLAGKSK